MERPEQVLYLDFDGVLHPEDVRWHPRRGAYLANKYSDHSLFENAPLLERMLRPYPALRVVLSTSWVRQYGFTGTCKRLPEGLRRRCVGATFHSRWMERAEFEELPRGIQVCNDVLRRGPARWLAIDDTDEGWPNQIRQRVILSDPVGGISGSLATSQLQTALEEAFGPSSLSAQPGS